MTKWIVVLEGQTHIGPFDDSDAAFDWIEKQSDQACRQSLAGVRRNDGHGMTAEPLISPESE